MTHLRSESFNWDDERIASLKALHNEGKSAGEISKLWKDLPNAPSRNAVMGKLKRAGLIGDPSKPAKRQQRHNNKSDGISATRSRTPGGHHSVGVKRLNATNSAPPPQPRAQRIDLKPVTLEHGRPAKVEDLNDSMCHFIIGDPRDPSFAYCGRISHGSTVYCAEHRAIVYQRSAA